MKVLIRRLIARSEPLLVLNEWISRSLVTVHRRLIATVWENRVLQLRPGPGVGDIITEKYDKSNANQTLTE